MAESDHAGRRERLQECLDGMGALAYAGPNLQYLAGFRGEPGDRHHALYLPAEGAATLLTPASYRAQAARNADGALAVREVTGNDPTAVGAAAADLADGPVTVDPNAPHPVVEPLDEARRGEAFAAVRRRKSEAELAALRRSAAVADEVSEAVRRLGDDAVGRTEANLAREVRARLHDRGAAALAFDPVVGSGPNGGEPGLRSSDRVVEAGDPVVLDFGCLLDGYASDQSRTVVFAGDPPDEFAAAHRAVRDALDAAVAAVEPGVTAGAVDAAARETLAERGYADRFTHPTGHGVGLDAHEPLTIGDGEPTELEAGMVFSVEPGVYREEFGVRVEDLVAVTDDGAERLNDSPRGWRPPPTRR